MDYTILLMMVIYPCFVLIFNASFLSNAGYSVQLIPQGRILLEKLIGSELVEKFPTFNGS